MSEATMGKTIQFMEQLRAELRKDSVLVENVWIETVWNHGLTHVKEVVKLEMTRRCLGTELSPIFREALYMLHPDAKERARETWKRWRHRIL